MKNSKIIDRLIIVTAILFFPINSLFAQAPEKLWESFYDGTLTGKDVVNDLLTDNQGNIYVTGKSYQTFAGGNFTTVMFNGGGSLIWADQYANTQSSYSNYGRRLSIDNLQNVYAAGTTALNDGDLAVCKYNGSGRIWAKNYEPYWFSTYDDFGIDVDVDSSGYFYAMARVTSPDGNLFDMYIMKCDSGGNKIWDENYTGASDADYPVDIEVTPGGNIYTLLQQFNFFGSGTRDISTFQYLNNGVQNWFSNYNGAGDGEDYPVSMSVDDNENQYVCGTTDAGGNDDMVIIKQNLYGTRLWVQTYNGTADGNDTAYSAILLPNGFAAATGRSKELLNSNVVDAIVTMVIDSADVVWIDKFYGSDNLGAVPAEMITDAQGNIYVCGYEIKTGGTTNGCLIKYNSGGHLIWNISYDGAAGLNDKFTSLALDINGDLLAAGQTFTSASNSNYLLIKYHDITTGITSSTETVKDFYLGQNYPNPFNPTTSLQYAVGSRQFITLKVYDVLGNEVATLVNEEKPAGEYEIEFNASNLSSGVYFYKLTAKNFTQTKKMMLLR